MRKLYEKYLKRNIGLINLFGKSSGRVLFLLLTSFFAFKLSVKDFATFAIFWTALRMMTFLSANNFYIVYFNKVREHLLKDQKWPSDVTSNVVFTGLILSVFSSILTYFIFDSYYVAIIMLPSVLLFIAIRNISEFSKSDDSLFLSIFLEDFLFYFLFFVFGVVAIFISNSFHSVLVALFITVLITAITSLILFKRKFKIQDFNFKISTQDFSIGSFKLGVHYTFLRGNDFFSSFGVRYLGQIYFGDIFVSYTHIMYQFYNVFTLVTMAVISGLQSKITVKNILSFDRAFINGMYLKILKTVAPFIMIGILIVVLFSSEILNSFFPKYIQYDSLLIKVSFIGFVYMLVQPLVFIFIYNNKVYNIRRLNITQYLAMFVIYLLPLVFVQISDQVWLLLTIVSFILIQGFYAILNYKATK